MDETWDKVPFVNCIKQGPSMTLLEFRDEGGQFTEYLPNEDIAFTDELYIVYVEPLLSASRGLHRCLSRLQPHNDTQIPLKS